MYYVGIDISKKSHQAVVIDEAGQIIQKPFKFSNNFEGLNIFLQNLSAIDPDLQNFEIGMEATGHYWLNLYTHLETRNMRLHVVNPLQSDAFRNLYLRKTKTDTVDSKIIAQLIRFGQYSQTDFQNKQLHVLRDLCRQRFFLVDSAADLKRKTVCIMDKIFPEYQGFFSDMFGKTSIQIMKNCPTPRSICEMDFEELVLLLRKASGGKFREHKAHELVELARTSFASLLPEDYYSILVKQNMKLMELLEFQIEELEKSIKVEYEKLHVKLTQIPGIGVVLGATIYSEIGDISRFSSAKKLSAFAGIDPSVRQSGEFLGSENHMSKRGSAYLRRALWMASFIGVNHIPEVIELYNRRKQEGKKHFQIMGYMCNKILNRVYYVLKTGNDYVPHEESQCTISANVLHARACLHN